MSVLSKAQSFAGRGTLWAQYPHRCLSHRFVGPDAKVAPHWSGFPTIKGTNRPGQTCRSKDSDDDSVDIDELAKRLSVEAERLRSEGGSLSSSEDAVANQSFESVEEFQPMSDSESSDGDQWEMLYNSIGDGGFDASDFELLQELGQISIEETEMEGVNVLRPAGRSSRTAVIAFTASYYSGMPFEDPVVTLLKEYLPGSQKIACHELNVLSHLCNGMPPNDRKWKVASQYPMKEPPIVELLGYFIAGPSGRGNTEEMNAENTIWIVQKWESLAPLSMYPGAQQTSGMGLGRLFGANDTAYMNRKCMVKAVIQGMLEAVAFCHDKSVAHGSLGSGTFLLSTFNDQDHKRLLVKLDSFGFAKMGNTMDQNGSFARALQADKRKLAIIILECIISAFEGPTEMTSSRSIERLLVDVYLWNVAEYKRYIEEDSEWASSVEFLGQDDNALWDILEMLVDGSFSLRNILKHSFFE
ncbi:hypothetical protein M9434_000476 [Picochlorum sp. BPE23]|nr:hypothetical protein M9434_000476 [Picochlorum sp. BPE23]